MGRFIQDQQTTGEVHAIPVVLIGHAACEADLIVLAIAAESRPGKAMRATSSEDPLQKAHLLLLCRGIHRRTVPFRPGDGSRDSVSASIDVFRGVLLSLKGPKRAC